MIIYHLISCLFHMMDGLSVNRNNIICLLMIVLPIFRGRSRLMKRFDDQNL
jgi:hypothetical protein